MWGSHRLAPIISVDQAVDDKNISIFMNDRVFAEYMYTELALALVLKRNFFLHTCKLHFASNS